MRFRFPLLNTLIFRPERNRQDPAMNAHLRRDIGLAQLDHVTHAAARAAAGLHGWL